MRFLAAPRAPKLTGRRRRLASPVGVMLTEPAAGLPLGYDLQRDSRSGRRNSGVTPAHLDVRA